MLMRFSLVWLFAVHIASLLFEALFGLDRLKRENIGSFEKTVCIPGPQWGLLTHLLHYLQSRLTTKHLQKQTVCQGCKLPLQFGKNSLRNTKNKSKNVSFAYFRYCNCLFMKKSSLKNTCVLRFPGKQTYLYCIICKKCLFIQSIWSFKMKLCTYLLFSVAIGVRRGYRPIRVRRPIAQELKCCSEVTQTISGRSCQRWDTGEWNF